MILGATCMSHTPYLDRARADPNVEARYFCTAAAVGAEIAALDPEVMVVLHPDHFNGFFHKLMPTFCIGLAARSVGDYGTVEGEVPIARKPAQSLLAHCLAEGFDLASSHDMEVDHGFAQPVETLYAGRKLPDFIPFFVNCAAPPRAMFHRLRTLGHAIGRWAHAREERIYVIASGGLSHDPPVPSLSRSDDEMRARLIAGGRPDYAARLARQSHVFDVGRAHVAGTSDILPVNPEWDRWVLDNLVGGRLDMLDLLSDEEITRTAGGGAHEVRTWIAALGALEAEGEVKAEVRFYAPVKEWITGTAILSAAVRVAA